jgi:hypothetical protein
MVVFLSPPSAILSRLVTVVPVVHYRRTSGRGTKTTRTATHQPMFPDVNFTCPERVPCNLLSSGSVLSPTIVPLLCLNLGDLTRQEP